MYAFISTERSTTLERTLVEKKVKKIEISIREVIENYPHDHVNKTVSLKNNSYKNALEI